MYTGYLGHVHSSLATPHSTNISTNISHLSLTTSCFYFLLSPINAFPTDADMGSSTTAWATYSFWALRKETCSVSVDINFLSSSASG